MKLGVINSVWSLLCLSHSQVRKPPKKPDNQKKAKIKKEKERKERKEKELKEKKARRLEEKSRARWVHSEEQATVCEPH